MDGASETGPPMMSVGTGLMWSLFGGFVTVALLVDFLTMAKQGPHRVSTREALIWSLVWVAVSFAFVGWLWLHLGGMASDPAVRELATDRSIEFTTAYLVEKALAVDNIFVFLMLFTYFSVPAEFQKRVLMVGILGALALRAIMILVGTWLIAQFHWVLYLFGAVLAFTGVKMWRAAGQEPDLDANPVLLWMRGRIRIAPGYDGERLFTRQDGVRMATPLLIVIVLIGIVDVVFAVDSIPAIFAITTDPFLVFTSNVFAMLGLRSLYFALEGMIDRFHHLKTALALVLIVVGVKMMAHTWLKLLLGAHFNLWVLLIVAVILAGGVIASLALPKNKEASIL